MVRVRPIAGRISADAAAAAASCRENKAQASLRTPKLRSAMAPIFPQFFTAGIILLQIATASEYATGIAVTRQLYGFSNEKRLFRLNPMKQDARMSRIVVGILSALALAIPIARSWQQGETVEGYVSRQQGRIFAELVQLLSIPNVAADRPNI